MKKNIKEAAAIKYTPEQGAPRVVASGKGAVAEKLIEQAQQHNVPLYTDPNLAHMLNLLKLGDEIPPELYEVVAQVLIFVSDLDKIRQAMK